MLHPYGHVLLVVLGSNAFWGFVGGVGYAGTRLSTALWGGREIMARARSLAVAQFVLSVLLAPAAAHTLTPLAVGMAPKLTPAATSFFIGLMFNAVWPWLVKPQFIRQLVSELFLGIGRYIAPRSP